MFSYPLHRSFVNIEILLYTVTFVLRLEKVFWLVFSSLSFSSAVISSLGIASQAVAAEDLAAAEKEYTRMSQPSLAIGKKEKPGSG